MREIILQKRKNGMLVMLGTILIYILAILGCIFGSVLVEAGKGPLLLLISILIVCFGWLPFLGLKVLNPQEALVLTLFGKYVGTLKGDGFFFVNPFCVGVNPAA